MTGNNPVKVAPLPFSAEQRQSLTVPVLLVLGEKDNLVGDPEQPGPWYKISPISGWRWWTPGT